MAAEERLWRLAAWRALASMSGAVCLLMVPTVAGFQDAPWLAATLGFSALGSILAQGCLLAVWLTWGDLSFGRRLLQHWVVAAVLCLLWLVGLFVGGPNDDETPQVGFTVAMTVPIISLATQFPLWTMRKLLGWRLVRAANELAAGGEPPWSIRDLFLATLIASIAIGIARLSPAFVQEPDFWVAWAMGGTAACIITCVTILPAAVLLLRIEPFPLGVRYSWLYAWSFVALLWLIVVVARWAGVGALPPYYAFIGLSLLILSFAGTVILAARVARSLGYRLVTRSRRTHPAWTLHPAR